jgi:hypothetical protein
MDGGPRTALSVRRRGANYIVRMGDKRIRTLVTSNHELAVRWVRKVRRAREARVRSGRLVVGLAVQRFPTERSHRLGVLQLCTGHRCMVFRLAKAGGAIPLELRDFLTDPAVQFAARKVSSIQSLLSKNCGLHVASAADIRSMAGMRGKSLEYIAERVLGYTGIPRLRVAARAWGRSKISTDDVKFAGVQAYLAYRLGKHFLVRRSASMAVRAPDTVHPTADTGELTVRSQIYRCAVVQN